MYIKIDELLKTLAGFVFLFVGFILTIVSLFIFASEFNSSSIISIIGSFILILLSVMVFKFGLLLTNTDDWFNNIINRLS
jgi:uncharacterized Tic20 family protein